MALTREISVTGRLMSACEAFTGLPEEAKDKYALVRMAERSARSFGLSPTDLRLLTLYVGYTRNSDWKEGGRPVYTRAVWRSASDLGISARQVNRSENRLEALGLIFRDTRADGGRGTVREAWNEEGEGRVIHCVDLRPLAVAWPMLVRAAEAARHREEAIDTARAGISRALRLVPRLLAEALALDTPRVRSAGLLDAVTELPERTPRHRDLSRLVSLHGRMEDMVAILRGFVTTPVDKSPKVEAESDAADRPVSDINNSRHDSESICSRAEEKNRQDRPSTIPPFLPATSNEATALYAPDHGDSAQCQTGLERLRTDQVIAAMPSDWRFAVERAERFSWRVFCHVAESRLNDLDVGRHAWRRLKLVAGRRAAAVALMALEANRSHPVKPVRNVGGAIFRFADIAATGNLRLDAMVIGILARRTASSEPA